MKKIICLLLMVMLAVSSAGCGGSAKETSTEPGTGYDVDLTQLSSTMIYSEVYNMMTVPEDYIGKKIRMNGEFALYQAADENGDPVPGQYYYACVVADATACCSQGLEFVLAGDYTYPDDYPPLGTEIVVSGIFETYDEDGLQFCHLVDAVFE